MSKLDEIEADLNGGDITISRRDLHKRLSQAYIDGRNHAQARQRYAGLPACRVSDRLSRRIRPHGQQARTWYGRGAKETGGTGPAPVAPNTGTKS